MLGAARWTRRRAGTRGRSERCPPGVARSRTAEAAPRVYRPHQRPAVVALTLGDTDEVDARKSVHRAARRALVGQIHDLSDLVGAALGAEGERQVGRLAVAAARAGAAAGAVGALHRRCSGTSSPGRGSGGGGDGLGGLGLASGYREPDRENGARRGGAGSAKTHDVPLWRARGGRVCTGETAGSSRRLKTTDNRVLGHMTYPASAVSESCPVTARPCGVVARLPSSRYLPVQR